jgi:hypothetical protein
MLLQKKSREYISNKATADYYKAFLTGGSFVLNPNSSTGNGAIFQTKETNYGDGTAVNGATETTGIITYFTQEKIMKARKMYSLYFASLTMPAQRQKLPVLTGTYRIMPLSLLVKTS